VVSDNRDHFTKPKDHKIAAFKQSKHTVLLNVGN
jgi:hypothetical protein